MAWFFAVLFLPSTWHLLTWMHGALVSAGPTPWTVYEALLLGLLLLSARLLTAGVAVREVVERRRGPGPGTVSDRPSAGTPRHWRV